MLVAELEVRGVVLLDRGGGRPPKRALTERRSKSGF
jgi:hypothetical protein